MSRAPGPAAAVARRRRQRPVRVSGDEREKAILEAASEHLRDRRLHDISVDDLARGAGISRPTFYFYFASKDAVLLALLERMVAQARRDRDEALARAGDDPVAAWRAGIEAFHRTWRAHRHLARTIDEARASSEDVRQLWSRVMSELVDETVAGIEAERARGAASEGLPARDLATCLMWMTERVLATTFTDAQPAVDEDATVDTLLGVVLAAVYGGRLPTPAV